MTRGENMHIFEKRKKDEENYQTFCEEVIEKLKKFASEDDNIEALYLVGSRAGKENSDKYSDFDVVFVVENTNCNVQFYNSVPINVEPPLFVELTITKTEQGARGDTVKTGGKPATLETGYVIQVPLFVNEGDRVRVDTRTGTYIERL